MPKYFDCMDGKYYKFDRFATGQEIGGLLPRDQARLRLLRKEDVYTPAGSDAKSLAKSVQKGKADWEGAHKPGFFPHYHPAGNHDDYGHVFYGDPNYRLGESRD